MNLLVQFLVLLFSPIALSLNEESALERRCIADTPLVKNFDTDWVNSVSEWYQPLSSRLDLYRLSAEAKGCSISEIREDELYYNYCLISTFQQGDRIFGHHSHSESEPSTTTLISTLHGFHGKKGEIKITGVPGKLFKFQLKHSKTGGHVGISLTDNKSFVLYIACWDDGKASWSVNSPFKSLDHKTVRHILNFVKDLGFKEKNFTRLGYETCSETEKPHEE